MSQRRFAILDRDGTLIVERHYLADPQQVELIPGVAAGLRGLRQLGLGLVVVTNQSAIGRGLVDITRLTRIHKRMCRLLAKERVYLDGIYWCPHMPEDGCDCRKPATTLVKRAAEELHFDPGASFVIGDKPCDIELGQRVGATTFLARTGYGAQVASDHTVAPDYVVDDLQGAVGVIHRLLQAGRRVRPSIVGR